MDISNEQLACIWLAHAKVSAKAAYALKRIYGNFNNVMLAFPNLPSTLISSSLKSKLAIGLKDLSILEQRLYQTGTNVVIQSDDNYPKKLSTCEFPPYVLFFKGNSNILEKRTVAIIGTRNPSRYGVSMAHWLATELGKLDVCIVSGLAKGIDRAAHETAIKALGKTAAVCGRGLAECYPKSNSELMQEIIFNGGIVMTEYDCDTKPMPYHFPYRNRVISALSDAVIFVEGSIKSGGMITVKYAQEYNKQVFAIPGQIGMETSEGPNRIIAEGDALCISCIQDLIDNLNIETGQRKLPLFNNEPVSKNTERMDELSQTQQEVYRILYKGSLNFNEISKISKIDPDDLQAVLSMLEIMGFINKLHGNYYEIVK